MGSRQTQFLGLNERAYKFIDALKKQVGFKFIVEMDLKFNITKVNKKPIFDTPTITEWGSYTGLCGEPYELSEFRFNDGSIYREVIQHTFWDSGPIVYTALEFEGELVEEAKWTESEVEVNQ